MNKTANASHSDRLLLFQKTGNILGIESALAEKDFWICWLLKQLYSVSALSDSLLFRGGTSLSKVYNLINRFSEDVDITVDKKVFGFTDTHETLRGTSRTKRRKLIIEMQSTCHAYIASAFLSLLNKQIATILQDDSTWSLIVNESNPEHIEFRYPRSGIDANEYVKPFVLLEIGVLAQIAPSEIRTIKPYAAEHFPEVFESALCTITSIKPERTFWDKVTILHAEHHRPAEKRFPIRHARHYYDLAMLSKSPICNSALSDIALFEEVVTHKKLFFQSDWARYDLATLKEISLMPNALWLTNLENDYKAMFPMFIGDVPLFEEVIHDLQVLERRLHSIA